MYDILLLDNTGMFMVVQRLVRLLVMKHMCHLNYTLVCPTMVIAIYICVG